MELNLADISPFKVKGTFRNITYDDIAKKETNRMAYRVLNQARYPSVKRLKELIEYIKTHRLKGSKNYHRSTPEVIADLLFFPERYDYIFKAPVPQPKAEPKAKVRSGAAWLRIKKEWESKFDPSMFENKYKSLDEFATFATDKECMQ